MVANNKNCKIVVPGSDTFCRSVPSKQRRFKTRRNFGRVEDVIKDFFREDGWRYEYDEEKGIFKGGVVIDGKLKIVRFFLAVRDDVLINRVVISLNADENSRAAVGEFVARANYGILRGRFELDYNDGEIGFSTTASLNELRKDAFQTLRNLMIFPCSMIEKFGDGLLAVMFGQATPKDVVDKILKQESAD